MLGLLIFLPTLFLVPHYAHLLAIPYLLVTQYDKIKPLLRGDLSGITTNKVLLFLILFCVLAMLNNVFHLPEEYSLGTIMPYYILTILTYFIAVSLTRNDLKVLSLLIGIEAVVMIFEFFMGVNTIFTFHPKYEEFTNETLLYFTRPFGLSDNSSGMALKLMVGLLLLDICKLRSRLYNVVFLLILVGIIISFNRTVMVALLCYYAFKFAGMVFFTPQLAKTQLKVFVVVAVASIAALIYLSIFQETILMQVTKGSGNIELSGRDAIWSFYMDFLANNPLFGNGSYKLAPSGMGDRVYYHAHNSFLQILGNHGLVLGLLYFGFVLSQVRMWNLLVVGIIFIFSMAQYGIFWGISTFDIFLFLVLFNKDLRALSIRDKGSTGSDSQ